MGVELPLDVLRRVKDRFASLVSKSQNKVPGLIGPVRRQAEVMEFELGNVHSVKLKLTQDTKNLLDLREGIGEKEEAGGIVAEG